MIGGTSLFGGVGTILGTVVGVFIPAVLRNGFVIVGVQPFWQQVAVGAVLIIAVYLDQLRAREVRALAANNHSWRRSMQRSTRSGRRTAWVLAAMPDGNQPRPRRLRR